MVLAQLWSSLSVAGISGTKKTLAFSKRNASCSLVHHLSVAHASGS